MGVEAGAGAEPLVALGADVRLLPGVGPDVPLQQTRPVERLVRRVNSQGELCTT